MLSKHKDSDIESKNFYAQTELNEMSTKCIWNGQKSLCGWNDKWHSHWDNDVSNACPTVLQAIKVIST